MSGPSPAPDPSTAAAPVDDVLLAARVLAAHGLVGGFGHLSVRADDDAMRITPPRPLGLLTPDTALVTLRLDDEPGPAGAPLEAHVHAAIYRARPEVRAVCRAQPEHVAAVTAVHDELPALNVFGAVVGAVVVHPDARLARTAEAGRAVATTLGAAHAVVLRGNGAVTVGRSAGEAVAAMAALEDHARLHAAAHAVGTPRPMPEIQREELFALRDEILVRYWRYLASAAS